MEVVRELMQKVKEPQILSYCGLETINFFIKNDGNYICSDCIEWVYGQNRERLNEPYIRECLLKCSVEDEEWTKKMNRNLTGIFYRKITFLPEIQDMICNQLNGYLQVLNTMYTDMITEEQKQKEETERQKNEWEVSRIFKNIRPEGGENGTDGYIDAEYKSKNGEVIRMVSKDIFDAGCFSYPKRLEGSGGIFNRDLWTESEKQLNIWLVKFGDFHEVRM